MITNFMPTPTRESSEREERKCCDAKSGEVCKKLIPTPEEVWSKHGVSPQQSLGWEEKMKKERPAWYDELKEKPQRMNWLKNMFSLAEQRVRESLAGEVERMKFKNVRDTEGNAHDDPDYEAEHQSSWNEALDAVLNIIKK